MESVSFDDFLRSVCFDGESASFLKETTIGSL